MLILWLKFFIYSFLIIFSGYKLTLYGDIIAEKTKMGRTWVGCVILAAVTSLPELITASSATIIGSFNLSIGDVLGSNMFNLLIIAVCSLIFKKNFEKTKTLSHALSANIEIFMASIIVFSLIKKIDLQIFHFVFSLGSLVVAAAYLISMYILFNYEKNQISRPFLIYDKVKLSSTLLKFTVASLVIIISGIKLTKVSAIIAETPIYIFKREIILGEVIFGSFFLAIVTSLPELIVSLSAMKLKASDLAIGNILGSNIFNFSILPIQDFLCKNQNFFAKVNLNHTLSALTIILMTSLLLIKLTYKSKRNFESYLLILIYFLWLFNLG